MESFEVLHGEWARGKERHKTGSTFQADPEDLLIKAGVVSGQLKQVKTVKQKSVQAG